MCTIESISQPPEVIRLIYNTLSTELFHNFCPEIGADA
jgi:hypothetical protein